MKDAIGRTPHDRLADVGQDHHMELWVRCNPVEDFLDPLRENHTRTGRPKS